MTARRAHWIPQLFRPEPTGPGRPSTSLSRSGVPAVSRGEDLGQCRHGIAFRPERALWGLSSLGMGVQRARGELALSAIWPSGRWVWGAAGPSDGVFCEMGSRAGLVPLGSEAE